MKIIKTREAGYTEAILGLSLSHYDHKMPLENFWNPERQVRAARRAEALAFRGGGHNKFLASIVSWWFISAPRFWWSEFDTYKVGTTAQSASTMHTLDKRLTSEEDFETGTSQVLVAAFNSELRRHWDSPDISRLKSNLPEGWLQERVVCLNYMSLQNILKQREGHRLEQWGTFSEAVLTQVEHPEFLKKPEPAPVPKP